MGASKKTVLSLLGALGFVACAMVLGAAFKAPSFIDGFNGLSAMWLPPVLSCGSVVASLIENFFARKKATSKKMLNIRWFLWLGVVMLGAYITVKWMLPHEWYFKDPLFAWDDPVLGRHYTAECVFWAAFTGRLGGILTGLITRSFKSRTTRAVALALLIAGVATDALLCAGLYGLSMAGLGWLFFVLLLPVARSISVGKEAL